MLDGLRSYSLKTLSCIPLPTSPRHSFSIFLPSLFFGLEQGLWGLGHIVFYVQILPKDFNVLKARTYSLGTFDPIIMS